MARDRGGPAIRHQILIYPTLDADLDTPSYLAGYDQILTRDAMRDALNSLLPNGLDSAEGYALPMRATDLAGLPPAYISVAVEVSVGAGLMHGYVRARRYSAVAEAEFQLLCAAARTALDLPEVQRW